VSARSTRWCFRRDTLEPKLAELVPASPLAQTVAWLRCLRGIDTLCAVRLAVEVGEFAPVRARRTADELPRADAQ
jgi:hypothetical protein